MSREINNEKHADCMFNVNSTHIFNIKKWVCRKKFKLIEIKALRHLSEAKVSRFKPVKDLFFFLFDSQLTGWFKIKQNTAISSHGVQCILVQPVELFSDKPGANL